MYAVGGATLVSSLLNARLVDELRLVVRPLVLGGGRPLFKNVHQRRALSLVDATPLERDMVRLTYTTVP
jgi:dihydrofolate reductase